jgi:hypothetical protein
MTKRRRFLPKPSPCAKRRYMTENRARWHLIRLHMLPGSEIAPTRIYRCKFCRGWHLAGPDPAPGEAPMA